MKQVSASISTWKPNLKFLFNCRSKVNIIYIYTHMQRWIVYCTKISSGSKLQVDTDLDILKDDFMGETIYSIFNIYGRPFVE